MYKLRLKKKVVSMQPGLELLYLYVVVLRGSNKPRIYRIADLNVNTRIPIKLSILIADLWYE